MRTPSPDKRWPFVLKGAQFLTSPHKTAEDKALSSKSAEEQFPASWRESRRGPEFIGKTTLELDPRETLQNEELSAGH